MTPERWQQVKEVFQAAVERTPAERRQFLDAACASDDTLRLKVEGLLASDEGAGDFIEESAVEVAAQALGEEWAGPVAGQRIGPYRIVREISHGGMGVVYLAERADGQYQKQVAVKLIKRGMDTDAILRRFRHERQILASLDHPNIARLLDGGTTDTGLPYFVMEYIEGQPVDEYCDGQKLSVVERLKLFRTVCAAVTYAHQNLVIHRDLKPGNILVTTEGTPKLLDFGIAKMLDPEQSAQSLALTATAWRVMTPEYASPEQIRGERVTTASDTYSLGVVLYELLTGHRPYRVKSRLPHEIARAICEEEPEKPSTAARRTAETTNADTAGQLMLTPKAVSAARDTEPEKLCRRLRGDLDNIVLMALRKEPERRYPSVEQFAEDIRRYLAGLPVTARKDTLSYRAGKFIQRNKLGVAMAALIVLLLLAGIGATMWQARVARVERAKADALKVRSVRRFDFDRVGGHILVANNPTLNPPEAITIEAWFTANQTAGDQFLVGKFNHHSGPLGNPPDDSYALGLDISGSLYWQVETIAGGSVTDNIMVITSPADVYDGQFHHLAATYDGATMMIYFDGEVVGSRAARGPIVASSTDLVLGGGMVNGLMALFQKGLLDEVRIYNRALSAEEIQMMHASSISALPGLVGWWRGDGDAQDSVGGNHGLPVGDVTFVPGKIGQAFSFDGK